MAFYIGNNSLNIQDFDLICRICLAKQEKCYLQHFKEINEINILDLLIKHLDIQINANDLLPKHICKECANFIFKIYNFAHLCKKNQYDLHQVLINSTETQKDSNPNVQVKIENKNYNVNESQIKEIESLNRKTTDNLNPAEICPEIQKPINSEVDYIKIKLDENYDQDVLNSDLDIINIIDYENIKHEISDNFMTVDTELNIEQYSDLQAGNQVDNNTTVNKNNIERGECSYVSNIFTPERECIKVTEEKRFQCPYCPKSFTQIHNCRSHINKHLGLRPFKCSYCDKSFIHKSVLDCHIKSHTGEKKYKCLLCDYSAIVKSTLKRHMNKHLNEIPYQCPYCYKRFQLASCLDGHIGTCDEPEETNKATYEIDSDLEEELFKFDVSTITPNELEHNVITNDEKHENILIQVGSEPNVSKLNNITIEKERLKSANYISGFLNCDQDDIDNARLCSELVNQKNPDLQVDNELVQIEPEVGDAVVNKKNKKAHEKLVCSYCPKTFSSRNECEGHKVTKAKKYKCPYCPKTFTQVHNCRSHINKHLGLRPYKCSYCNMSFGQRGVLDCHIKSHTGEKRYKCYLCDYRAIVRSTLKRHMNTHLNETPYQCPYCDKRFLCTGLDDHIGICDGSKEINLNTYEIDSDLEEELLKYDDDVKTINELGGNKVDASTDNIKYKVDQLILTENVPSVSKFKKNVGKTIQPWPADDFTNENFKNKTNKTKGSVKRYTCSHCLKPFRNKLKCCLHEYENHGVHRLKCPQCSKRFTQMHNWKHHVLRHLGSYPFKCSLCNKAFVCNSELTAHMKIHTKEKKYKCTICSYDSFDQNALASHMNKHLSEAPKETNIEDNIINKPMEIGPLEIEDVNIKYENDLESNLNDSDVNFKEYSNVEYSSDVYPNDLEDFPDLINISDMDQDQTKSSKCPQCDKEFGDNHLLDYHMREVHSYEPGNENNFPCSNCSKTFKSTSDHLKHARTHNDAKEYECKYCFKIFTQVYDYKTHINRHINSQLKLNSFVCSYCNTSFEHRHEMKLHEKTHTGEKEFKCQKCSYSCITKYLLKRHISTHLKDTPYQCPYCYKKMKSSTQLDDHIGMCDGSQKLNQDTCESNSDIDDLLANYLQIMETDNIEDAENEMETNIQDDNLEYNEVDSIDTDIKSEENANKINITEISIKTELCNMADVDNDIQRQEEEFKIDSKEAAFENINLPVLNIQKRYVCSYCNNSFAHRTTLNNHIRTHTGEKPYECLECGKRFLTQGNFTVHKQRHSGIKQYACKHCDKTFWTNSESKIHMRTHTGEKLYACTYCPKTYTQLNNLKSHLNNHLGVKPYVCSVCNKGFTIMDSLSRHIKTHTNDKRHSCSLCEYKCIAKSTLRRHMGTHQKKKLQCSSCGLKYKDAASLDIHTKTCNTFKNT